MLRKIQFSAALVAIFFGAFAYFDFFAVAALQPIPAAPWPGVEVVSTMPDWLFGSAAVALAIVPWLTMVSLIRCHQWIRREQPGALDHWRRLTWGTSIVETTGCLLFIMHNTVIYVPSAVALLIVGVAELASILQDVERIPVAVPQRATT